MKKPTTIAISKEFLIELNQLKKLHNFSNKENLIKCFKRAWEENIKLKRLKELRNYTGQDINKAEDFSEKLNKILNQNQTIAKAILKHALLP